MADDDVTTLCSHSHVEKIKNPEMRRRTSSISTDDDCHSRSAKIIKKVESDADVRIALSKRTFVDKLIKMSDCVWTMMTVVWEDKRVEIPVALGDVLPPLRRLIEMTNRLLWGGDASKMLAEMCAIGNTKMAMWITDRFHWELGCYWPYRIEPALWESCKNGHTDIVIWLIERFSVSILYRRELGSNTLRMACEVGQLNAATHLVDKFSLTASDVRPYRNNALLAACRGGHLDVVKWLVEKFSLTVDDARAGYGNSALLQACENGHLDVAEWLVEKFSLTVDDVRAGHNYALCMACRFGYLEIVKWLVDKFSLTIDDINAGGGERSATFWAFETKKFDVLEWLVNKFKLSPTWLQ